VTTKTKPGFLVQSRYVDRDIAAEYPHDPPNASASLADYFEAQRASGFELVATLSAAPPYTFIFKAVK
jgi:hypothetical protein